MTVNRAQAQIVLWGKQNIKALDDYNKANPNNRYNDPTTYGWRPEDVENVEAMTQPYDWADYVFPTGDNETKKTHNGQTQASNLTQNDLLTMPHSFQQVQTTSKPRMTNIESISSISKYLLDENLMNDAESTQIVKLFCDAVVGDGVPYPWMYKKTPVLADIEVNETVLQLPTSSKLIMQLLLDVCQLQLEIKPITINHSCIFDFLLCCAWRELSKIEEETAQSLIVDNMTQVNDLSKKLWVTEFVQNIIASARYELGIVSWIESALAYLHNKGFDENNELQGIFPRGKSISNMNILNDIRQDMKTLSKNPLSVLRNLRHVSEAIFYFSSSEIPSLSSSSIIELIGTVYEMGSIMDWSWIIDLINGIHLDAVTSGYTTQMNLLQLLDYLCEVAAAWRALGTLGGFDGTKLIKNDELKHLWSLFVHCALCTIIEKIYLIESQYPNINEILQLLNNNADGMLHLHLSCGFYVIVFCVFFLIVFC